MCYLAEKHAIERKAEKKRKDRLRRERDTREKALAEKANSLSSSSSALEFRQGASERMRELKATQERKRREVSDRAARDKQYKSQVIIIIESRS